MISRVSNDGQTDKTSPTSSEQPTVTKSHKSTNSSESKTQLTANKSSTKRKLQSEGKNSEKKKAKIQSSEMSTTFEYDGIGSYESEVIVNKEDKILSNCIICTYKLFKLIYCTVPSWKVFSPSPSSQNSKAKSEVKSEVLFHRINSCNMILSSGH